MTVSMALLADRAGVVKGTLYLYFKTREEVFLALYDASLVRWSHVFIDHLDQTISDLQYAEMLYDTAFADGNFVPLQARLEKVIEHNVSIEQLVLPAHPLATIAHLSNATASALDLSNDQATVLSNGRLIGRSRWRIWRPRSPTRIFLPTSASSSEFFVTTNFYKNAHRIIQGIRHGALEPEE